MDGVARRIIKAASDFSSVTLEDLYAEACISVEPGGGAPAEGIDAIRAKAAGFEAELESGTWNARNQWVKGNTIAIEWEAQLRFKNGRSVTLEEIAVHEIRGGKIVAERYYYDPAVVIAAMAPEPPGSDPPLVPEPAESAMEEELSEVEESSTSPVDPIDL